MRLEEVERVEGVGRGVIGLIWLWKCVEKSKVRRKITAGKDEEPKTKPEKATRRTRHGAHPLSIIIVYCWETAAAAHATTFSATSLAFFT